MWGLRALHVPLKFLIGVALAMSAPAIHQALRVLGLEHLPWSIAPSALFIVGWTCMWSAREQEKRAAARRAAASAREAWDAYAAFQHAAHNRRVWRGNRIDRSYELLELRPGASSDDIKRSYRRLALQWHPDRLGGDTQKFQEINNAFEALVPKPTAQR